jgi:hypothetical protein
MSSGIRSIMISESGYRRTNVHSQEMAEEEEKEAFVAFRLGSLSSACYLR